MKRISTRALVIHTTASNTKSTAADIMRFFTRILRWQKGGYHAIIERNGQLKRLYDYEKLEATNGILPDANGLGLSNENTIHVSYIGGISNTNQNEAVCNITPEQEKTLLEYIDEVVTRYPWIKIVGHNQLNLKYCPSFWLPDWISANRPQYFARTIKLDPYKIKEKVKSLPHPRSNFYESKKVCEKCGKELM